MAELYNCRDDKGFRVAFTQNAEEPGNRDEVGQDGRDDCADRKRVIAMAWQAPARASLSRLP
jgi:hypothetical protein